MRQPVWARAVSFLRGALGRRIRWNVLDQVLSSGTNALLAFLVARQVDAEAFGGFALAFTVFALVVTVTRSLAMSPMSIRFSNVARPEFLRAARSASGLVLSVGTVAGTVSAIVGFAIGGPVGMSLIAFGVVLPGLLVQDSWRLVLFAALRPAAAAANDAVWAAIQMCAVAGLIAVDASTPAPYVLAWGGAAWVAAAVGARQVGAWPDPRRALSWWHEHRDLTRYFVAEDVTVQSSYQGSMLLIGTLGGVIAVGSLRAAQVLIGPVGIFTASLWVFAVPEISRRSDVAPRTRILWAQGLSLAVATLSALWGLLLLVVPDAIGVRLLGQTWSGASHVVLPAVAAQVAMAFAMGPASMLYALARSRATFSVHIVLAPLLLAGGVMGVTLWGTSGAAWGFAAAYWAVVPLWWYRLGVEVRRPVATTVTAEELAVAPEGAPLAT